MEQKGTTMLRRPFEKDPVVQRRITALLDALVVLPRGSVLDWGQVEQLVEEPRAEGRARYVIMEARRRLLRQHGVATRCRINAGVYMLHSEEQLTFCPVDRRRRAGRQIKRAAEEVSVVDTGSMSEHFGRVQLLETRSLQGELDRVREGILVAQRLARKWNAGPGNGSD